MASKKITEEILIKSDLLLISYTYPKTQSALADAVLLMLEEKERKYLEKHKGKSLYYHPLYESISKKGQPVKK